MTTSAEYTPSEAAAVIKAVMASGMAVAIADIGIVSTAIEAAALAKEVSEAATTYPNNSIIQSVFSETAFKQAFSEQRKEQVTSDNAIDLAIAAIREALVVLTAKASNQEIEEYKAFIYAAAERVANAAGSGLFGSGDPKVSDKETAALAQIKEAIAS